MGLLLIEKISVTVVAVIALVAIVKILLKKDNETEQRNK
jgi:hypothetical protein